MENVEKMSPAVLANVGILMMTSQDVGWKMMLVQWLEKCDEADKELMTGFCDIYIEKTIEYLSKCCQPHMFGNNDTKGCPRYTRVINHSVENMVGTFTTLLDVSDMSGLKCLFFFNQHPFQSTKINESITDESIVPGISYFCFMHMISIKIHLVYEH